MPTLIEIAKDPNYINASSETKAAIFNKWAALDPNYANANSGTQQAIRAKFGVTSQMDEAPTSPQLQPPQWSQEHPDLYRNIVKARQALGPTIEAGAGMAGAILGGGAGSIVPGPGTIAGSTIGAGLLYGAARGGLRAADERLGLRAPSSLPTAVLESAKDVATGALEEGAGGVAAEAIGAGAKGVATVGGMIVDSADMPTRLAAQLARTATGVPGVQRVISALRRAPSGLTAQQALARDNVIAPGMQATLERAVQKTGTVDTRLALEAQQEAARAARLRQVTPDINVARAERTAASRPLYEAADKAIVPMDAELASVFARLPENTLKQAANIAKMEGRPFILGKTTPPKTIETGVLDASGKPITREVPGQIAEITGESLHYIKRALSDFAYGPVATTGAGRDAQSAARHLLDDYLKIFERKVPEYGAARRLFAAGSEPVNQAQVLKEMLSVLEKPGGGERIGPFLNVLGRGEQAMLRRAGGRGAPRYESLDEVLTPEQITQVREVARQLETETRVTKQVSEGAQRAVELIKDELPQFRLPSIFNIFATTANKVLEVLTARVGTKTLEKLADAAMSAKSMEDLLKTLPAEERIAFLKTIGDPDTWKNLPPVLTTAMRAERGASDMPSNVPSPESAKLARLLQQHGAQLVQADPQYAFIVDYAKRTGAKLDPKTAIALAEQLSKFEQAQP